MNRQIERQAVRFAVAAAAGLWLAQVRADITNRWDFGNPADYEVSNPVDIEVANGVAKLKLQADRKIDSEIGTYYTNGTERSQVSIGSDVSIVRALPYNNPAIFTSRVLDHGGGANLWERFQAKCQPKAGLNAGGEIPKNMNGLVCLMHLNNTYLDVVSNSNGVPAATVKFVADARLGSRAADFRVAADTIQTPTYQLLNDGDQFTISFWMKPREQKAQGFVSSYGTWYIGVHNYVGDVRKLSLMVHNTAVASTSIYPLNEWTHVAATWRSSDGLGKIFINGKLDASGIIQKGTRLSQTDYFHISGTRLGYRANATIDEVAIFSRCLTDSEAATLYLMPRSALFQVRSSDSLDTLGSKTFCGPDGTLNSFYTGNYDVLGSLGDFKIWDRYAQYKAYLYGPAYPSADDPFLDAVGLTGNFSTFIDNTEGDFKGGQFTDSVAMNPTGRDSPYLGLAKTPNGGYQRAGQFTSAVIETGKPEVWYKLAWGVQEEVDASLDGNIVGCYHMNGGFADASPKGNNGAGSGVDYTANAKLGSRSAVFNGTSSYADIGGTIVSGSVKSVEFWIKDEYLDDGILQLCNDTTNHIYLAIEGGMIVAKGVPNREYTAYVNGSATSRRLLAGWNHVAVVSSVAMPSRKPVIGRANGDYLDGMLDELVLYSRALDAAEVNAHYMAQMRQVAGRARLQVRSGDALPLTGAFIGPDGSALSYFDVAQHSGAIMHGSIFNKSYLQYRVILDGDGDATPVVRFVRVDNVTGQVIFKHQSHVDFDTGDFDGGKLKWVGDEIKLQNVSLMPGLVNLKSPTAGLAGLWHLDEAEWLPGATVKDSASGNDGSPQNGTAPSMFAKVGTYCGKFDGADDYIIVPGTQLDGDFTVSAWFKSASSMRAGLVCRTDTRYTLELNSDGLGGALAGAVAFTVYNGSTRRVAVSSVRNMNDGNWHHVAAVRNGDAIYLYVDGTPCASTALATGFGSLIMGDTWLGAAPGTTVGYLNGYLDEVALHTRALSDADIDGLMAVGDNQATVATYLGRTLDAGQPAIWEAIDWREGSPYGDALNASQSDVVGLWHMDETSGTRVDDATAGLNHGTINGVVGRTTGRFGRGLNFDGGGGYVGVPANVLLEPNTVTVKAWFKPAAVNSRTLVDKRSGGRGYALATDADGKPYFWLAGTTCKAPGGLQRGFWYDIVGTYDGSKVRLFVNGFPVATQPLSGGNTSGGGLRIGLANDGTGAAAGVIDEVAVFNRALGAEDVMDQAKAGFADLRFQVRVANDTNTLLRTPFYGPNTNSASYFTLTSESMVGRIPLGRYFQYKAYLSTTSARTDLRLQGLVVNQSHYPTQYPWVMPAAGKGMPFVGRVLKFSHVMATNTDASVRYQLSGDDGANWYWWNGMQWAGVPVSSNLWPYANTWDVVNTHIGSVYDELYPKVGGTFRFKAFLSSPGDLQVAINEVKAVKAEGAVIVVAPNGKETGDKAWVVGVPYDIRWLTSGRVSKNLAIDLYRKSGAEFVKRLASGVSVGATNFYRTVISDDARADYRIRLRDLNDVAVDDWSDGDFQLVHNLHLSAPDGGEHWYLNTNNIVRWESPGPAVSALGPNVLLWFSADAGATWVQVASVTTNMIGYNAFNWQASLQDARLVSETAKMAVSTPTTDPLDPLTYRVDYSDTTFTNAGIVVTYPSTGDGVKMGNTITIRWKAAGAGTAGANIDFFNGQSWTNVAQNVLCLPGTNSYTTQLTAKNPTQSAKVRVTAVSDPRVTGTSLEFTLADINVVAPLGGTVARDRWQIGSDKVIKWTAGGAGGKVNVEYAADPAHTNWQPIVMDYTNVNSSGTGIYTNSAPPWRLLGPPTSNAVVRVKSVSQEDLYDITEPFDISGVQVTQPNGGEIWEFTATNTLMWLHQAAGSAVGLSIAYENNPASNEFETIASQYFIFGGRFTLLPSNVRRPSNFAWIKITALDPPDAEILPMFDVSDKRFAIHGMSMVYPTNRAVYTMGTIVTDGLQWYSAGADDSSADVYYAPDGVRFDPAPLSTVLNSDDGPGAGLNKQNFTVPRSLVPSTRARMKVAAGPYQSISPEFTLRGVRFTRPARGEMFDIGARNVVVQWVAAGISPSAYASNSLSVAGQKGPFLSAGLPSNAFVPGFAMFWDIDKNLDPSTNAVIRMTVTTPAVDTDVVMYSDPFTLRGLKVKSPATGDVWPLGTTRDIKFLAAGMGSGARANLYYAADGRTFDRVKPIALNLSVGTGTNTYSWLIESSADLTRLPSTNATVMVVSGAYTNVSTRFTVKGIKVTSPNGSDIWAVSDVTNRIRWTSIGTADSYTIAFHKWNDTNIVESTTLATGVRGNFYDWLMPASSVGKPVSITVTGSGFTGNSERFEIVPQPSIRIISPAAGDFWKVGETNTIRWSKGGQMDNAFVVRYATDPFAVTNELIRGACDFADGVYSLNWVVPFQLGRTRLIITNQTEALVKDTFEGFDIAAKFDIQPFTKDIYALETVGVEWITRGDVQAVDLYYSTDFDRSPASWVKINTEGPYSENVGHNRPATPYPWTAANAKSDSVWLRIQDHDYPTQRFNASLKGPFDDYGPFQIHYYNVTWWVFDDFERALHGTSNHLGQLSVTDNSGWSASGLNSPVTHEYPYGRWNTVWYREFFSDKVVFNWASDHNMTNIVFLERSKASPDYRVLSAFTFEPVTTNFTVQSWIERGGTILGTPETCKVEIYDSAGKKIESMESNTPVNGVFWQRWDVAATGQREGKVFDEKDVFFARVEIRFSGVWYSSGVTFTLRVSASKATMAKLESSTDRLLEQLGAVGTNLNDAIVGIRGVRSAVEGGMSNLSTQIRSVQSGLSNSVLPALSALTNDVTGVIKPAITNMQAKLTNMEETVEGNLARILTRPVTVVKDKPITILYKSRRNYTASEVRIAVEPVGYSGQMTEVVGGMGIYEHELPMNWNVGTYTIACTDPRATDRLIIEVVDQASLTTVPSMLVALSNRMDAVFMHLTNITAMVDSVGSIEPFMRSVTGDLGRIEYAVTNTLAGMQGLKDLADNIANLTNAVNSVRSITNVADMVISLTNALRGVDWSDVRAIRGDVEKLTNTIDTINELPNLVSQLAQITNSIAQLRGVTNISSQLTELTNRLFGVQWNDITRLRQDVTFATNALKGLSGLDQISTKLTAVTNSLRDLDWEDVLTIQKDLKGMTNLVTAVKQLSGLNENVSNVVRSIGNLSSLTNLQASVDQLNGLTNRLSGIDWNDIGLLRNDMIATTNALGRLTDLKDVASQIGKVTNMITQLNFLTNTLAKVDWGDIDRLMADVTAATNALYEMRDLASVGDKVGVLTNILPKLSALTNQLANVNWNDILAIQTTVNQMTNTLKGLGAMGDIAKSVDQLTNVMPQLTTLSEQIGNVNLGGMAGGVSVVSNLLSGFNWRTMITSTVASSNMWSSLEQRLGSASDSDSTATFFGRLARVDTQLRGLDGNVSSARRKAQTASTAANGAKNGIRKVREAVDKGDLEGALSTLRSVRSELDSATARLHAIPDLVPARELRGNIDEIIQRIEEMALQSGIQGNILTDLKSGMAGGPGGSVAKDTVESLNKNMQEVKSTLDFMQKVVDEMQHEPLVESTLLGGE